MTTTKTATALAVVLLLGACAGRAPQQIAVVQPQDSSLDCTAIIAETTSNNQRITALATESSNKVAQNVAAGVAGLLIWPLWFAMDFQGAASKDTAALQSRQQYLATLAGQKGCTLPPAPAPAQPEAAKLQGATQ